MESQYLDTKQAAEYLHISVGHLLKLVREGKIRAYRSRKKLFLKADLDEYLWGA
jgi:excisionase family DNA binding protein